MLDSCKYVRDHYGVPAVIGRRVVVSGKPGIIAADRGHYIGVNLDEDRPGVIANCHPTSEVVYGEIGVVRKPPAPTRAQGEYQAFIDYEYSESFAAWLGIEVPEVEFSGFYAYGRVPANHYRYRRREFTRGERWSPEIVGDWKPTKKEAKASYKEKLKARRDYLKSLDQIDQMEIEA